MNDPLVVLGVTGSIGLQTLEVAERNSFEVDALAARRGSAALFGIARRYPAARIVVAAPSVDEREALSAEFGERVQFGADMVEAVAATSGRTVVNGIVGSVGLAASVAALEAGNRLALANKESLVAGGPVVLQAQQSGGGVIIPVDSEHSALFQCLVGEPHSRVKKLVLTASGGPFFGRAREDLESVTKDEALAHPTWVMGSRVTIDSATLFNKGLEVIEAHFLFGIPYEQIDVVVHPQSIVHSMVEFVDGSVKAQLGEPDMRVPIQYAITYPDRRAGDGSSQDLAGNDLTFREPDRRTFPALDLAYEAGRRGGSAPAVLNAADEVAVKAFLDGRIGFLAITDVVERTLNSVEQRSIETVADVFECDAEARDVAVSLISGSC